MAATETVRRARATTRSHLRRACRVPVAAALTATAPAVRVPRQVPAVPVRALRVPVVLRAVPVPVLRVPVALRAAPAPQVPVETVLLRA
ncbi:hypothetical protein SRABI83_04494 [Arthrobacter sp. Bi83]|nr:hypothetical protein SRABI83_04494 [Arthrobacter sp. Bi83]